MKSPLRSIALIIALTIINYAHAEESPIETSKSELIDKIISTGRLNDLPKLGSGSFLKTVLKLNMDRCHQLKELANYHSIEVQQKFDSYVALLNQELPSEDKVRSSLKKELDQEFTLEELAKIDIEGNNKTPAETNKELISRVDTFRKKTIEGYNLKKFTYIISDFQKILTEKVAIERKRNTTKELLPQLGLYISAHEVNDRISTNDYSNSSIFLIITEENAKGKNKTIAPVQYKASKTEQTQKALCDSWDKPLLITANGKQVSKKRSIMSDFTITSAAEDGTFGTEDDIVYTYKFK